MNTLRSVPTVDTRWFQNALADNRLSQRKLAEMMGVDPSAVTLMFRGKRAMSAAEAATISTVLKVSVDEVLARAGIANGGPIVGALKPWLKPAKQHAESGGFDDAETEGGEDGDDVPVHEAGAVTFVLPVPMSDGSMAQLVLPKLLTKADADRIAAMVAALAGG